MTNASGRPIRKSFLSVIFGDGDAEGAAVVEDIGEGLGDPVMVDVAAVLVVAAQVVVAARVIVTVIEGILTSSAELLAPRVEDEVAQKDEVAQEVGVGSNGMYVLVVHTSEDEAAETELASRSIRATQVGIDTGFSYEK